MKTKEKLQAALKDAMKSKDDRMKRVVRMAISMIRNAEIDRRKDLDEPEVLAIVQKEIKSRRETIEGAELAGRSDMIEEAEAEIAILETFLPQQLSETELESLVDEAIQETGATSPREMGQVMSVIMPKVSGRAEGKVVSEMVRNKLTG